MSVYAVRLTMGYIVRKLEGLAILVNFEKGRRIDMATQTATANSGYVIPLVHSRVPESVVDIGFYGLLAGTVALGVIDAPLVALVGLGVVVARHRRN